MNKQEPLPDNKPIRIKSGKYEEYLNKTYRKDEICIFFEEPPSEEDINIVKDSFKNNGFNPNKIEVKKCDNCNAPVVLFKAPNIHTFINAEGVKAGSGRTPPVVGEKYSLNFYNNTPFYKWNRKGQIPFNSQNFEDINKEKIVVAVLDTGFDPDLIEPKYLWKNPNKKINSDCYPEAESGWNFVNLGSSPGNGSSDFKDDHPFRHGSVVCQYIINEFKKSPINAVQIMPLKTHDERGLGDLFGIICAIYFAIANGVHIINASWGFYYYQTQFPYLNKLMNDTLKEKGILFITAAGNLFEEEDEIAKKIYLEEYGENITDDKLRNLAIHNFYPANFSKDENSVITATTTDGKTVSPTQNYSNIYVDLGVLADTTDQEGMKFQVPFAGNMPNEQFSGSSFATAIATGIIGAYCEKKLFQPNLNKSDFFNSLSRLTYPEGSSTILVKEPQLATKYVKEGAFIKRTP